MKDHNVYDPLLILTSQVSHFRPVSITMRETVRDSSAYFDLPLKRMIEISEINRYVEGQISLGTYISESESKLSFMREFEIPFAMIAPDYPLDSVLTPHFIRLFSSPSGWDFCRFTDEPRNRILGL